MSTGASPDDLCAYPPLARNDFIWDQVVKVAMISMLLLAVLGATAEHYSEEDKAHFCGSVPPNLGPHGSSNVSCSDDAANKQYFLLLIVLHVLLTMAPYYVWCFAFSVHVERFFDCIGKLDPTKLRTVCDGSSEVADFFDEYKIVIESLSKHRRLIFAYKLKLALQLILAMATVVIIVAVFDKFPQALKCPADTAAVALQQDTARPLRFSVCSARFPLFGFLRTVAMALVSLCGVMLLYGSVWCFLGHPTELGSKQAAIFTFASCLEPEHTFHSLYLQLRPNIEDDLDYVIMQLFRSDSVRGHALRHLLVQNEYRELSNGFAQLLDKLDNCRPDVIRGMG